MCLEGIIYHTPMQLFLQVLLLAISGFGLVWFGFFCALALVGIGCSNTKVEFKNGVVFFSLFFVLLMLSLFCVILHFLGFSLNALGLAMDPLVVSSFLGLIPIAVFFVLRRLAMPSASVLG